MTRFSVQVGFLEIEEFERSAQVPVFFFFFFFLPRSEVFHGQYIHPSLMSFFESKRLFRVFLWTTFGHVAR